MWRWDANNMVELDLSLSPEDRKIFGMVNIGLLIQICMKNLRTKKIVSHYFNI
jgi:hypothetical protein